MERAIDINWSTFSAYGGVLQNQSISKYPFDGSRSKNSWDTDRLWSTLWFWSILILLSVSILCVDRPWNAQQLMSHKKWLATMDPQGWSFRRRRWLQVCYMCPRLATVWVSTTQSPVSNISNSSGVLWKYGASMNSLVNHYSYHLMAISREWRLHFQTQSHVWYGMVMCVDGWMDGYGDRKSMGLSEEKVQYPGSPQSSACWPFLHSQLPFCSFCIPKFSTSRINSIFPLNPQNPAVLQAARSCGFCRKPTTAAAACASSINARRRLWTPGRCPVDAGGHQARDSWCCDRWSPRTGNNDQFSGKNDDFSRKMTMQASTVGVWAYGMRIEH